MENLVTFLVSGWKES